MKLFSVLLVFLSFPSALASQEFSCPVGQADVMKYFAMSSDKRADHFLKGRPNPTAMAFGSGNILGTVNC